METMEDKPTRIWVLHMPFKKNGFPVVGTFGAHIEGVVIMKIADWTALCNSVEALKTRQFEVGSYED